VELRPKIETAIANVTESTTLVRHQLQRLDATVTDAVDRARLQVIRADELLSRTMDKVEDAAEMVHETVVSPVRRLSGILNGVQAALDVILGGRRRRNGVTVPQDEMFI
jgi:hypothetical protein